MQYIVVYIFELIADFFELVGVVKTVVGRDVLSLDTETDTEKSVEDMRHNDRAFCR